MIRLLSLLAAALLLLGCAGDAAKADDPHMVIRIINAGREPLQCRLMFGHWVDRDLGLVTSDNGAAGNLFIMLQQQSDGALYEMRDDGQRRMMVENIFCARPNDWQATVGQIDLASVRTAKPASIWVTCALPEGGGRVVCAKPRFWLRGTSTVVQ